MANYPDYAGLGNLGLIEELYGKYRENKESVDPSWRHFFEGVDFAQSVSKPSASASGDCRVIKLIDAYRKWGHLAAQTNPLETREEKPDELSLTSCGFTENELKENFPTHGFCPSPQAPLSELVQALESIYCSNIGFEYFGLGNSEMEQWIRERIEPKRSLEWSLEDKKIILERLDRAETFEAFLHTKYVGQKRFSIEGAETLLPILCEIVDQGAELGMEQFVLGMAHRGRLNVLANLLQKPYSVIFQEFDDALLPLHLEGSGDVKYHKGFSSDIQTRWGKKAHLHLAANSSCLESVDPVALGLARAKQVMAGDEERKKVGAILIHGDASLSGQGVVYESLEFMRLPGYATGGTIHIAVNNQIGFTTLPQEGRSTRYCTDIAKTFSCPVFHVNAEDPESCIFIARLAVELRLKFQCDVFIDLLCYRKYGHNEGDEPAFTQPLQYKTIRAKKTIRQIYAEQLSGEGGAEGDVAKEGESAFRTMLDQALEKAKGPTDAHQPHERFGVAWGSFQQPPDSALLETFDSSASEELLVQTAQRYAAVPKDFHLHPKLQKWVQERLAMTSSGDAAVDWGMAECLAFGSLLLQQVPIRLAGQDSRRGTFSHRHAVWIDQENGSLYFPYSHLSDAQARFDVYNSPLSEFASLAFEYGYSWADPNALVLWEAQYGDFTIGAQTVVDHYITTAEKKWARYSSIVLLLPHGYEGQGPEHSSGRIERFLQLAAQNNTQIANPTTPAQYFHLLRRQALRKIKKPLIVFTPKGTLRLPACVSPFSQFSSGSFEEVLSDSVSNPRRILLCSGRIYFDLAAEREKRKAGDIAIVRIEQLYPLNTQKLREILSQYPDCKDLCWVQDEPQNMGAWEFIHLSAPDLPLRYLGRERSGVTATGSHKQHVLEQDRFMKEAFA